MMPAEFLKVQIISIEYPAERILVQFCEVVGFTKGVVRKLPIEPFIYCGTPLVEVILLQLQSQVLSVVG